MLFRSMNRNGQLPGREGAASIAIENVDIYQKVDEIDPDSIVEISLVDPRTPTSVVQGFIDPDELQTGEILVSKDNLTLSLNAKIATAQQLGIQEIADAYIDLRSRIENVDLSSGNAINEIVEVQGGMQKADVDLEVLRMLKASEGKAFLWNEITGEQRVALERPFDGMDYEQTMEMANELNITPEALEDIMIEGINPDQDMDYGRIQVMSRILNRTPEELRNSVAKAKMEAVAPAQTFWTNLGVDEGIKIERKLVKNFSENKGVFSKSKKRTPEYLIVVTNNKKEKIKIIIREQLPISNHKDLTISLLKPDLNDNKFAKLSKQNKLEWTYQAKAGKKLKLPFKYSIEYPADKILTITRK